MSDEHEHESPAVDGAAWPPEGWEHDGVRDGHHRWSGPDARVASAPTEETQAAAAPAALTEADGWREIGYVTEAPGAVGGG